MFQTLSVLGLCVMVFRNFICSLQNIWQEIDRYVRSRVFIKLFSVETRLLKLFTEISLLYYPLLHLRAL
jgi:hypothetical protein